MSPLLPLCLVLLLFGEIFCCCTFFFDLEEEIGWLLGALDVFWTFSSLVTHSVPVASAFGCVFGYVLSKLGNLCSLGNDEFCGLPKFG